MSALTTKLTEDDVTALIGIGAVILLSIAGLAFVAACYLQVSA